MSEAVPQPAGGSFVTQIAHHSLVLAQGLRKAKSRCESLNDEAATALL